MEELSLEEVINKNGYVLYPFKGVSMLPLLDEDFDIVKIIKSDDYQISDIILFKKPTGYVLHRIIDIKDNTYFIKGDNASFIDEINKFSTIETQIYDTECIDRFEKCTVENDEGLVISTSE